MIAQTVIFFSAILFVSGLYEDQAGTYDWKQDYVGKVKHILWESVSHGGSGKKVFVATDRNIIASLNTHDGSIAWRQVSEEGPRGKINALLYNGNHIISVQAGGRLVRSWHAPTGNLHWETFLPSDDTMSAPAMFLNGDRDSLIVATSESLVALRTSDGKKEWETALPDGDTVQRWYLTLQRNSGDIVAVGVSPGLRVTVATVGADGKGKKTPRKLPAQWALKDTSCQAVGGVAFVCYTADTSALQFLALAEGQVFKPFPFSELGSLKPTGDTGVEALTWEPPSPSSPPSPPSSSLLLLRVSGTHMALINVSDAGLMLHRDLPKVEAADVAYEGESRVLLTVQRADPETVEFTGVDLTTMKEQTDVSQRISLLQNHGSVEKIFPMLFTKKKDGRLGAKVLMVTQDYALHCAHKAGKAPWHREEALAYIVGVEMVDLPVSENEAKFEDEFGSSRDDIFAMFVKRIKVQLSQLKGFVKHLIHRLSGHHHHQSFISKSDAGDVNSDDDDDDDDDGDLVRDSFSLHKMIVAVTSAGKVYGMRSHNGRVAWQHFFPGLAPFSSSSSGSVGGGGDTLLLFVQRTTAHFPHAPQCAVVGASKATGNGLLFTFNPVTGAMLTDTPPNGLDLGYKVIQAQLLYDHPDENFLKGVLLIDSNVKIHFFPESTKSLVQSQSSKMFLHLTDIDAGLMKGYWLLNRGQDLVAENVWSIDLQGGQQKVTGVYTKRPVEHVHSQGRVLGDRSVLYKYLNPNLVVLVAEGQEASVSTSAKGPSGFFSVYLVDAVTGHIVFHENHKRTRGPVNVVHAENWVVYSFYSEKHRRYEMAVLELYEGKEQSNATAFSSLAPPPHPLVLRQSYIFPVPIHCMASSVTEKGITNKNIIMALKVGGVLSLPKALLDPRRPSIPSQETMEEGTIPYIPELPVSTENFINYNRSIFNVRGIHTAPAGLESTSLVLIYGSDIFYTRVMPSKMFDVLKEDFDYIFIAAVLAIMIVVSVISQKLAARKALKRAWK